MSSQLGSRRSNLSNDLISGYSLRVGLLGGTFDPVHQGHIEMAEAALRMARLDAVHFVTSIDPPHKSEKTQANFLDRHAMVALALARRSQMIPSSREYSRPGKSYSIDTVREFMESFGQMAKVFFLIGIDAFLEISSWKDYNLFPQLCTFIIFARPGFDEKQLESRLPKPFLDSLFPLERESDYLEVPRNTLYLLRQFSNSISSTEIRKHIHLGKPISGWVPETVEEFIHKTKLYSN